jgi:hypothetical protein
VRQRLDAQNDYKTAMNEAGALPKPVNRLVPAAKAGGDNHAVFLCTMCTGVACIELPTIDLPLCGGS